MVLAHIQEESFNSTVIQAYAMPQPLISKKLKLTGLWRPTRPSRTTPKKDLSKFEKLSSGTGLEKVSFHSSPKEGQCQRIYKLPYNYAYFTCYQGYAQNPSNWALALTWTENFQMYKLGFKEAEEPEIKLSTFVGLWRKKGSSRKTSTVAFDNVDQNKLWKILKEMGLSDHLTCLLRNGYVG